MRSVFLPPQPCCRRAASPTSRRSRSEIRESLARHFLDVGTVGTFLGYKVDDYLVIASDKNRSGEAKLPASTVQDSQFGHRTGDRRGRRSRQGCLPVDGVVRDIEA